GNREERIGVPERQVDVVLVPNGRVFEIGGGRESIDGSAVRHRDPRVGSGGAACRQPVHLGVGEVVGLVDGGESDGEVVVEDGGRLHLGTSEVFQDIPLIEPAVQ